MNVCFVCVSANSAIVSGNHLVIEKGCFLGSMPLPSYSLPCRFVFSLLFFFFFILFSKVELVYFQDVFWKPLHEEILFALRSETLTSPIQCEISAPQTLFANISRFFFSSGDSPYPYHILDYNRQVNCYGALPCTRLLALTHIVWHHMSIGQLSVVSQ